MAEEETGTWLTQEAYDRLKAELDHLRGPWRKEIAKRIEEARAEGDLRENGGYHAAKDEQGVQEGRIRQLESLLRDAKVGTVELSDGKVARGSLATVKLGGKQISFLLGNREIANGDDVRVYSEDSPLGHAVVGHSAGDKVSYQAPNGKKIAVEIISVTAYQG